MPLPAIRFGPTSAELAYLHAAFRSPWTGVWAQAGIVAEPCPDLQGAYETSDITFLGDMPLRVGSQQVGPRYEELCAIAIHEPDDIGAPTHERHYVPRRRLVTAYPPGLDLSPFLEAPRSCEILSIYRDALVRDAYDRAMLDVGLLVTAQTGERLLLHIDEGIPFNLLVTRRDDHIGTFLGQAQFVRSSFEEA